MLALLAVLLPQVVPGPASPTAPPPRFEFPPGAIADLAAGLAADAAPAAIERADLAADWSDPSTAERWRAALEAAAGSAVRPARARLALLALRQGRADDAWRHVEVAGADSDRLAALLPRFLPGISAEVSAGRGGLAGAVPDAALPDGIALAPATPPRTRAPERGRVERRAMRVRGLRIGDAVVGMRVAVEPEGVQVDLEHISGGEVRVAVKLPSEPGFALANEYVDWFQAETRGVAHVVVLKPGDEEHTLYGRFEPRPQAVTIALPTVAPAALELGGLAIRPEPGPEGRARAEAMARALSGAPAGLAARVVGDPGEPGSWSPVVVDLSDPRTSAEKLAALCGAVERFVLR